jgi:hypothetical protein
VTPTFSEGFRSRFRAVAEAVLPPTRGYGQAEWAAAEEVVASALADRPSRVRRQLSLFLRLLDAVSLVRTGRTVGGLPPDRRARLLLRLERSRILAVRRGVWGVRTLALMGHYVRDPAREAVGYRAHPDGWRARPGGGGNEERP